MHRDKYLLYQSLAKAKAYNWNSAISHPVGKKTQDHGWNFTFLYTS